MASTASFVAAGARVLIDEAAFFEWTKTIMEESNEQNDCNVSAIRPTSST